MRKNRLWFRCSYVYVLTAGDARLLVQKRTMKKDYCPGFFTLATGGLVGECEQDDESAYREVKEEIGLTDF